MSSSKSKRHQKKKLAEEKSKQPGPEPATFSNGLGTLGSWLLTSPLMGLRDDAFYTLKIPGTDEQTIKMVVEQPKTEVKNSESDGTKEGQ